MTSRLSVDDPGIARLLEDPRRRRLLLSFVKRELSLKQAADLNEIALNLAHYHAQQLVTSGLIEVTREAKRNGRPIRYYRAKHDSYFVPSSLMRSSPAAKLEHALKNALDHMREVAGGGVLFDVDENGRPRMQEVEGEGELPLELWRRLNLSRTDAAAMFREIADVVRRHGTNRTARASSWTIHVALAQTKD